MHDLEALRLYWLGLRTDSQRKERDWWCNELKLSPEEWDDKKGRDIVDNLEKLHDPMLRQVAKHVLRGKTLYDKLKTMHDKEAATDEKLVELSAMVLMPVTTNDRGARYGHLLFVKDDEHPWISELQATTDRAAYNAFYHYTEATMTNILCDDYRSIEHGGIRSLHPYIFNTLTALKSTGDHPAALLLGCRSGVQYPMLDSDGRIIAMVALYLPVYGFFSRYCTIEGNTFLSPKVKEAWARTIKNGNGVERAAKEAEKSWTNCWSSCGPGTNGSECNNYENCLARIVLEPYRNSGGPGMMAVSHLAAISGWPGGIEELVKTRLPDVLGDQDNIDYLVAIKEIELNEDRLIELGDLIVGLRGQIDAGEIPGAPRPEAALKSLKSDRMYWIEVVETALKDEKLRNARTSLEIESLKGFLVDDLWNIMKHLALLIGLKTSIGPLCKIDKKKDNIRVQFNLIHWHFRGNVREDMKGFKDLFIIFQDGSGKKASVIGILGAYKDPAYKKAWKIMAEQVGHGDEAAAE